MIKGCQRLAVVAAIILASPAAWSAGWTAYSEVLEVEIHAIVIKVKLDSSVVSNINSCANFDGVFAIYNGTANFANDFESARFSSILAALHSGKKVSVYSDACSWSNTNDLDKLKIEN